MQLWIAIICIVAAVLIGGAVGIFLGITIRKNTAEKEIGSAEEEARKIVADAIKAAEAKKKEVSLRVRTRFIASEPKAKKSLPTGARRFSVRNAAFSRRKKLSTESSTIWSRRKRR